MFSVYRIDDEIEYEYRFAEYEYERCDFTSSSADAVVLGHRARRIPLP